MIADLGLQIWGRRAAAILRRASGRTGARIGVAAIGSAVLTFLSFSEAHGQSSLNSCRLEGVEVRCGTISVPEHYGQQHGRKIALRVFVLPAEAPANNPPLFVINGGPGGATVDMAGLFFNAFAPVRRTRDIVLIDQRGTGESNALRCEPASGRAIVPADSTRCLRALSRVANLRFYGTDDAVRDLDFVRATLGYERIDVLGFSYGTRVAWWYARTFPVRLRTIVMVSPNPPSQRLLQSAGEDFDRALHLIVADCLANADCANRFPRFEKELPAAIGALTPTQRVAMPLLLYSVDTARRLPWMVNRAAAGDKRPLEAALSSALGAAQRQISLGLHLTVQCSEEFATKEAVDRSPVGSALSDEYADACRDWPRMAPPRGFRDPFRSGASALIIAGEWDPATPPRWADESARLFQDARVSIVAKGTHGLSDVASCLGALVAQFLDERPMQTQCLHALASRPYFLGGSSN